MDTSILEDIGLTGAEIKVFIALLELGPSQAGNVVEKSGLQNAVVHRAFHSLIEKGLISYVLEGKIKNYQAIEPKLLINFLDEKKAQLEKIIPELEAKKKKTKMPIGRIFQGKRGIKELLYLIIETESKEYISYGGSKKSDEVMGTDFWDIFHNKRISKKISAKLLFHSSLSWWGGKLNKYNLTSVKITEKDFEELTETIICGNRVGIIIWSDKPFGFLIESAEAAKSYTRFFKLLWKSSRK
jgi:sugar-specific transcriptional regulator TrmB